MSGAVRIDRRLYLVEDKSRVVEDGDLEAATLLCAAGGEVPYATAARYGLLPGESGSAPDEGAEPDSETPTGQDSEEKARRQVPNKARSRSADK